MRKEEIFQLYHFAISKALCLKKSQLVPQTLKMATLPNIRHLHQLLKDRGEKRRNLKQAI